MVLKKMIVNAWNAYLQKHRIVDFGVVVLASVSVIVSWEFGWLAGASVAGSVALFTTVAGLSGTLLGFTVTSMVLLLTLFQSPEFGPLRKCEAFETAFSDYRLAMVLLGTTTLVGLGAMIACLADFHSPILLGIVLGMVAWSALTLAHALEILWLAIRTHVKAEQNF